MNCSVSKFAIVYFAHVAESDKRVISRDVMPVSHKHGLLS